MNELEGAAADSFRDILVTHRKPLILPSTAGSGGLYP